MVNVMAFPCDVSPLQEPLIVVASGVFVGVGVIGRGVIVGVGEGTCRLIAGRCTIEETSATRVAVLVGVGVDVRVGVAVRVGVTLGDGVTALMIERAKS